MIKKHFRIFVLSCVFMLSCVFAAGLLPSIKTQAEDAVGADTGENITYDKATVYDLYDIVGEKDFTSGAEKNRNIGQMPSTHNVAFKAKFSYDESSKKILIINFIMGHKQTVNTEYFLRDCGYMFYFRDNTAKLVYCGDGTETNQLVHTAAQLDWAELSAKLSTIDNLEGDGKISAEEWRYGREAFEFEMGYVKAYTGDEWTGNYVYVKINGTELMSFTDTSAYYQDKGTYFGKGATGYDYTYYTFGTTYSFACVKMENAPEGVNYSENDMFDVIIADNAVLEIPTKEGYAISSVTLDDVDVTDKLTWTPSAGVLECSELAVGEHKATVTTSQTKKAEVLVYDLFDLCEKEVHTPSTKNDETQNIGAFPCNSNVAFRANIQYPDAETNNHNIIINHLILKSTADSHFASGGYGYQFLMRDREMSIRYDKDPATEDVANEIVAGAKLKSDDIEQILTTRLGFAVEDVEKFYQGKVEFTFEFGCADYLVNENRVANYVYVKINDVEIMHFIDNGENYKADDLGLYTGRGADGREYSPYCYATSYKTVTITMEDVPAGADFRENAQFDILVKEGAQLELPLKFGYVLKTAALNGEDVTASVREADGRYVLDCSGLISDATLKITTELGKAKISIVENEKVQVSAQNECDLTGDFEAEIITEIGYTLSSLKINGKEHIDEVSLGDDGVYSINGYQVLEDITIETQVQQTRYSVTVTKSGDGSFTADSEVDAFGRFVVTFTPVDGGYIKNITLNGEKILVNDKGEYVVEKVMRNLNFMVEFAEVGYSDTPIDTNNSSSSSSLSEQNSSTNNEQSSSANNGQNSSANNGQNSSANNGQNSSANNGQNSLANSESNSSVKTGCRSVVNTGGVLFAGILLALATFTRIIKKKKD